MFGLGFVEILVILCVVLIVLGPERLPGFARTMGRQMAELRRAADQFRREVALPSLDSELRDELEDLRRLSFDDDYRNRLADTCEANEKADEEERRRISQEASEAAPEAGPEVGTEGSEDNARAEEISEEKSEPQS